MKNEPAIGAMPDALRYEPSSTAGTQYTLALSKPKTVCLRRKARAKGQSVNKMGIVRPFSGICLAKERHDPPSNQIR
jgi:hypothetical protein